PDYGIVSAGSFPVKKFDGAKFPFVQDSLTFTFSGATGLDLAKLTGFRFFFGTNGNSLTGTPVPHPIVVTSIAPEPSMFGVAALGAAGMLAYASLRRRVSRKL